MKSKTKKKLLAVLMVVTMVVAMLPSLAFAQNSSVTVSVKIENTTFTENMGNGEPAWSQTLLDTEVTVPEGSTMFDVLEAAAAENSIKLESSSGYVSSVNGLSSSDAGMMSGWMTTLNDWFADVTSYIVEDGDEVALLYSVTGGSDLGGYWDNNDKTVKAIEISDGQLSPAFDRDTKEYTLTLDDDVSEIYLKPEASNKNFQVHVYVNSQRYKATQAIPVSNGTVIEVICGDPSWPTMNEYSGADDVPAETYTITVNTADGDPTQVTAQFTMNSRTPKAMLYASGDTEKNNDLLSNAEFDGSTYTLDITPGRYVLEGLAEDGITSTGSASVIIDEKNADFEVLTAVLTCGNEGWKYGDDYTIENLQVRDADSSGGISRSVDMGVTEEGNISFLMFAGDSYSFRAVPSGEKTVEFAEMTVQGSAVTQEECNISFTMKEAEGQSSLDDEVLRNAYEATGAYLAGMAVENGVSVASVGGDWIIFGLARAGYDVSDIVYKEYYDNVEKYVSENINDNEQLHSSRSTDNSRVILTLTAIGRNVTDVAGHNLLIGISDMEYIQRQGINGVMYALIAFDSGNYQIPKVFDGGDQVTREKLIDCILDAQLDDGGWSLAGSTADIDMTAIAIQSLAPYYDSDAKVKTAVDRAVELLSERQSDNGGYGSFESANIESCAQVLTALSAMGIDPKSDSRFVKNGNTVLDAVIGYYLEGGGFEHVAGHGIDQLATEQAYYAMTAYFRMISGKTKLNDMSDVVQTGDETTGVGHDDSQSDAIDVSPEKTGDSSALHIWFAVAVVGGAAALAINRRTKRNKEV